jgi:hypothetical protein
MAMRRSLLGARDMSESNSAAASTPGPAGFNGPDPGALGERARLRLRTDGVVSLSGGRKGRRCRRPPTPSTFLVFRKRGEREREIGGRKRTVC